MLKKRIIFTLLFYDGFFVLSRNFKLQKVGDLNWLKKNYNFQKTAKSLDELIILNVRPNENNRNLFNSHVKEIAKDCFIPISAGGGINNIKEASALLKAGADKIIINTLISKDYQAIIKLSENFGQQCIIGSVDFKLIDHNYEIYVNGGKQKIDLSLKNYLYNIMELPIGELYLNSIDRDGTGQGLMINAMEQIPQNFDIPIIFAGGIGNWKHIYEGLSFKKIDAVSTAHLFNFVNDGLFKARNEIINSGINIPLWK